LWGLPSTQGAAVSPSTGSRRSRSPHLCRRSGFCSWAYAYKPLHHPSITHAFVNAILFLDYHRRGFDYPVITMPLNCYGRRVVSAKGFLTRMGDRIELDPPSPSPRRFMEMGAAGVHVLRASPWRVALVASSSWSHAFLCDWTHRLRPDTDADRRLHEALLRHDFAPWRATSLADVETAGQQELLNWFALMGAVEARQRRNPRTLDRLAPHAARRASRRVRSDRPEEGVRSGCLRRMHGHH
jgi:hypothetical protein